MELKVGLQRAAVASAAPGLAVEQPHTRFLLAGEGRFLTAQVAVEGAVVGAPFELLECGDGVGHVADMQIQGPVDVVVNRLEAFGVVPGGAQAVHQHPPAVVDASAYRAGHFVFFQVAGHFRL